MRPGIIALALLAAPRAYADDPVQAPAATQPTSRSEADQLFDQGRAAYQANHFHEAIEKFQQAYALAKDAVYLFNIAQAYRNAADCLAAHDYYERYLNESPAPENVDSVRNWLRELEPCASERKAEQAKARRADELEHAPPPVAAPAAAAATSQVVRDDGRDERIAGLAVGGVGVLGVMIGIVYGVKGQAYEDEIRLACSVQCDWDQLESRHAAGQRANTLSLAGYIGGGLALVGGAALYVHGRMKLVSVDVAPTTGGAQIGARVRF